MGGFDWVFTLGRVVATTLEGAKRALLANVEGIEGETANKQLVYGPLGWFGRPLSPDSNGAAEVICIRTEDGLLPIGMRDPRLNVRTNGKEGEVGIAQYDGGFVSLKRNADGDGTDITLYAPKADGSAASVISIDTSDANSNVTIMHDTGVSVQLAGGKALVMSPNGQAYIQLDNSGIVLNGNVQLNGSLIVGDITAATGVLLTGNVPSTVLFASVNPPPP